MRPAAAVTLDRVVASIENLALTEGDIEEEYRFEMFLNGQMPEGTPGPADFEQVRDRLVNLMLLEQEAKAEGMETPDVSQQAVAVLNQVRSKFGSEEVFQSALRSLNMEEPQVLERLAAQQRALRIIDQRLRPAAWVEPAEIETYYAETFKPEYLRRNTGTPPPLEEVEPQIREILVQKEIDQLLAKWLGELRATRHVRIHTF